MAIRITRTVGHQVAEEIRQSVFDEMFFVGADGTAVGQSIQFIGGKVYHTYRFDGFVDNGGLINVVFQVNEYTTYNGSKRNLDLDIVFYVNGDIEKHVSGEVINPASSGTSFVDPYGDLYSIGSGELNKYVGEVLDEMGLLSWLRLQDVEYAYSEQKAVG